MTFPIFPAGSKSIHNSNHYFIQKSLRFRSSASASLSRTPASASNRTTWTWSGWVKRAEITTTERTFFSAGTDGNNFTALTWNNDKLFFQNYTSGSHVTATTTAVYRDPSAWYHIVLAIDTTQGTAANRAKIYVNGVQQDGFNGSSFSSSQQFWINFTYTHRIGSRQLSSADSFSEQYLTEVYFIDGQALDASAFGEYSTFDGVWIPKKYSGTYGANGFYLDFKNNANLGKDAAGSNDWTLNGIDPAIDHMNDVPTLTSETQANYWTLNPLNPGQLGNIRDGNLSWIAGDQNNFRTVAAPALPNSGKFYWEVRPIGGGGGDNFVSGVHIGIIDYSNGGKGLFDSGQQAGTAGKNDYIYSSNGDKLNNGVALGYGTAFAAKEMIGVAVDIGAGKIWFSKGGTWQASGDPAAGTGAAFSSIPFATKTFAPGMSAAEVTNPQQFNFGQHPFKYTPPAGFKALNTFNLPEPSIKQGNKYFDATTYTGNGSSLAVTNSGSMQPDFVWIKSRSNAYNNVLSDSVRGISKWLISDSTDADQTFATYGVTAFNSNGFTVGLGTGFNGSGATYVAWQWKAKGAAVANTDGTIPSQVSVNKEAGFSIVSYTGTGANGTIGHGLGAAPSMIIVKQRNASNVWGVGSSSLPSWSYHLRLNANNAESNADNFWNSTAPISTVFTIGDVTGVNGNSGNYIAYCFSEVPGYSKFGSYTGNGNADGTFVYTGFRPRFVMFKGSSIASNWCMLDSARNTYNLTDATLQANSSAAELTNLSDVDFLSNGIKIRDVVTNDTNVSGQTYIYMAFAEHPFKYSNAR